ncbi:MAG: hypothetical protein LBD58_12150 [Treponema sp.]|jgi:hypothetical protein|nr:hypothetical protein [Treponema sp.]
MKNIKKTNDLLRAVFVFSVFFIFSSIITLHTDAEPMREGESLPPGYPLMQAPQTPEPFFIPENLPERAPLQLPLTPPPEPIARTPPPVSAGFDASPVFSRSVKVVEGRQVDIPFSGSGWVYLGETSGQKGVAYSSHRLEKEGQNFTFIAEKSGAYALKFYKQDFIRDYTLNDYVQVIVTPAPAASSVSDGYTAINRGPVVAEPRWPSAEQEAAIAGGAAGGGATPPATPASGAASEPAAQSADAAADSTPAIAAAAVEASVNATPTTPDQFLKNAQAEFDAKNYAAVVSIVEQFRAQYPNGADDDDEAWWLYAQACEANGPVKDIKTARYFYQRIVNEYPFSDHHSNAQKRISYIDRYYINIQ